MIEEWKDINGYEGLYEVSNMGKVKSLRNNIILSPGTSKGYDLVLLYNGARKGVLIHRLVAEAFIPNDLNKPQVNHIDGNKKNNRLDNLEWATLSENVVHAYTNGLIKNSVLSIRRVGQYDLSGELIKIFNTIKEAAKEVGADDTSISHVCRGEYKTSCGFVWKYIGEAVPIADYFTN